MKKAIRHLILAIMVLTLFAQPIANAVSDSEAAVTGAQIATGSYHSMVLMPDGRLYTFGSNVNGVLGSGRINSQSLVPQAIGDGFTAIAAGSCHNLAIKGDDLYTWGDNAYSQLGYESPYEVYTAIEKPVRIDSGFTEVFARESSSFGLKGDVLYAWGLNMGGNLGVGTDYYKIKTPQKVGSGFTAISPGSYHTLALKKDVLYAWGENRQGEVGISGKATYNSPMKIGAGYSAIAAGCQYSMALKNNDLYMWGKVVIKNGANDTYTIEKSNTPKYIGTGYTLISAGDFYVLVVKDGELLLYDITMVQEAFETSRVVKRLGKGFTAIEISEGKFALGIKEDGIYSWGAVNDDGQLGNGTTRMNSIPTRIDFTFSSQASRTNQPASTPRITSTPIPTRAPQPTVSKTPEPVIYGDFWTSY